MRVLRKIIIFAFCSSCIDLTSSKNGDDFDSGSASVLITGANLHSVVMNCTESINASNSTISCSLGFEIDNNFVKASGFEEDSSDNQLVFASWDYQRLYGVNLSTDIVCDEQNLGIDYICTFAEYNKAVRYTIEAELTRPSSSQERTVSNSISFFNLCATSTATTYNAHGSGTAIDPYILCNADQLKDLANKSTNVAHQSAIASSYRLGANITNIGNLKAIAFSAIDPMYPAPHYEGFSGVFQGNGYTISDIVFERNTDAPQANDTGVGLFSAIHNGRVDHLTIDNAISDDALVVPNPQRKNGILAGALSGSVQIDHIHIKNSKVVGRDAALLAESLFITAPNHVGANVIITNNTIESSTIELTDSSQYYAGFILHVLADATLFGNYQMNISENRVIDTTYDGNMNTNTHIGGFIGHTIDDGTNVNIQNNFVRGCSYTDFQPSKIGGFVALNSANVIYTNNYSACAPPAGSEIGGFFYSGFDPGANGSANNYWDTQVNNTNDRSFFDAGSTLDDVEGKTTAQMQNQATFVNWDFTSIWSIQAGQYPDLRQP